jgi:hypothetical protein
MLQTGILEHFSVILLSPMHFILQKNPSFHIYFVQTLADTGCSLKHRLHTEQVGMLESHNICIGNLLVLISEDTPAFINQAFLGFLHYLQISTGTLPKLRHERFIPKSLQAVSLHSL